MVDGNGWYPGVMAVDAALAAIVIGARGAYGLWIVALALLGLSLGLAVRTLRLPGAEETGPSVAAMREAREDKDDNDWKSVSVIVWVAGRCRPIEPGWVSGWRRAGSYNVCRSADLTGLVGPDFLIPVSVSKLFRRTDTPATR